MMARVQARQTNTGDRGEVWAAFLSYLPVLHTDTRRHGDCEVARISTTTTFHSTMSTSIPQ